MTRWLLRSIASARYLKLLLRRCAFFYLRLEGFNNYRDLSLSGEMHFVHSLKDRDSPTTLAIDCGSHEGHYARLILESTSWHVILIEPSLNMAPKLRFLQDQFPDRCSIFECAVGAEDGITTLFEMPNSQHSTTVESCLEIEYLAAEEAKASTVQLRTLDSIVEEFGFARRGFTNLALLKLDVEGSEIDVLYGAQRLLQEHPPSLIQIESNIHNLFRGTTLHSIARMLQGYRVAQMLPYDLGLSPRRSDDWISNLFLHSNFVFLRE